MGIEVSITGSGNTAVAVPGPAYTQYSQSFPSGSGFNLSSISLKLALGDGAPGSVECNIYAADGNGFPISLTKGTATVSAATLNTYPSWSFKVFTFNPVVTLLASTQYCFVISTSSGAWDVNYIYIGTNGSDTYANGVMGRYDGSWSDANNTYPATIRSPDAPGSPPTKAENPSPTDANASVTLDQATITWDDGGGADTFNVYYGTDSGSLPLVSSAQAGTTFTVTGITDGAPYAYLSVRYWRIDSTNGDGTTEGDEWSFTTIRLDPPTQTYFYAATGQYYQLLVQPDGSYGDPPGVGVENTDYVYLAAGYEANFISTNRKLVAAAENRIWMEDI